MTFMPRSIGRRLATNLGLSLSALWVAGVIATGAILYHEQGEMLDANLRVTADLLLPLARVDFERAVHSKAKLPVIVGPQGDRALDEERRLGRSGDLPLVFLLRDGSGAVVLRSAGTSEIAAIGPRSAGFFELGGYVLYQTEPDANGFQIVVGGLQAERTETLIESVSLLILLLALLIPLGWLALRQSLRQATGPLAKLNQAIQVRGGANLEPIELADLPVELRPIVDETNGLMVRLRAALSSERAFAANSAHELRTPLAVALAQANRLIAETNDNDILERAHQVEASLKHLGSLVERLLQLARAEAGIGLSETETDLTPVLRLLIDEFRRKVQPGRAIRVSEPLPSIQSRIDPDAFGIIISNLLDNAFKHGDPAVSIDIKMPDAGTISIINGSPVIPADRLAGLVRRHHRGHTRGEGLGIGLSIVEALTRQAGGRLQLFSPARSAVGGFEALVTFNSIEPGTPGKSQDRR